MLVILCAIKKWYPYLIGRHFKVKTGHDNLNCFLEKRIYLKEQQKWVAKTLCYNFEIIYKNGKQNIMENALLKKKEDTNGLLYDISFPQSHWVEEAMIKWQQDEKTLQNHSSAIG